MPERLQKILSACGAASRREAEKMIRAGRVSVNGSPASLGQSADLQIDAVEIDGKPLAPRGGSIYVALYKPRGYVTTMSDERGRKTVMSLVEDAGVRIYPVGRLDIDSEGLLLLTNDGAFANTVAHPSTGISKTYEAHVRGDASSAQEQLRLPVQTDSGVLRAVSVKLLRQTSEGGVLQIVLTEGRNRQIRKMCDACGLDVRLLKRVAIGAVALGSLRPGQWRRLTDGERDSLMSPVPD